MKNTTLLFVLLMMVSTFSSCKKDGTDDPKVTIGQDYQGGIVFYVDDTGKHGLIAATSDLSAFWQYCTGYNCGTLVNGAYGTAVGTGKQNTIDIVNALSGGSAAYTCDQWVFAGYDDWFLPSIDELKLMYQYKDMIGTSNPLEDEYWSSTQVNEKKAYTVDFLSGAKNTENKESKWPIVRAVRAF